MQFQQPSFLWALTLIAIPILIHLFNLRRHKTVYFSDIRFLKDVQKSTKRQKNLKEWLVLLSRILAFTFLVLAFAKPFIPADESAEMRKKTVIVLDNSVSNSTIYNGQSVFETNKQKALNVLAELPNTAEVAVISASANTGGQNFASAATAKKHIENTQLADRRLDLQATALNDASVFMFSDFQKNECTFLDDLDTSHLLTLFLPENENTVTNLVVDSAWTEAPFLIAGQPVDLFLRIKNYGDQNRDANLELNTNGLPEIQFSAPLPPQTDTVLRVKLTQLESGFNSVEIVLTNDEVEWDDRVYLTFYLPLSNNVLSVYQDAPNTTIQKLFQGAEFSFQAKRNTQVRAEDVQNADLIIVNELTSISSGLLDLLQSATQNANLFIIPPSDNLSATNQLLENLGVAQFGRLDTQSIRTESINTEDPFFADVFAGSVSDASWPQIFKHYKLRGQFNRPSYTLLTLANGDPLFVRVSNDVTNIFQSTVSFSKEFSDIQNHPVIVPLFIKALMKKGNINNLSGIVGQNQRFDVPFTNDSESPIELQLNTQTLIPRQQRKNRYTTLLVGNELNRSGSYALDQEDQQVGELSFRIDPKESDTRTYSYKELETRIENLAGPTVQLLQADSTSIAKQFSEWQLGKQYWRYFLLVALIFVLVEVILLRFLK